MSRKAQIFTIENLLFFALGIMLVVMFFITFNNLSQNIKETGQKYYEEKLGQYILYGINTVYYYGNKTNSTIIYYLPVPSNLGDCYFRIEKNEKGELVIFCPKTGVKRVLNLYGIEYKIKTGYLYSSQQRIIIEYKNGMVYLR